MFSRYDMHADTWSMYYYKDVAVLKNKLTIKDYDLLKEAEDEITYRKALELTYEPIKGNFTINHFCNIHKYIFGDLYYFAGKLRYEDISKGQTRFCGAPYIKENLQKTFKQLKDDNNLAKLDDKMFFGRLAYYMAELNVIHPFREGNGRATMF